MTAPFVSSRLVAELPAFAPIAQAMALQGYALSAVARVSRRSDGTVDVRLVWRRRRMDGEDSGEAVLHQPLLGRVSDRLLDALGDALL